MIVNLIVVLIGFVMTLPNAFASQAYALFERNGNFLDGYDQRLVDHIFQSGDQLDMGDGKFFEFRKILGVGGTTVIIDIGHGLALRIPKSSESIVMQMRDRDSRDILSETAEAYEQIRSSDIPRIRYHAELSNPRRYLVMDLVQIEFTLMDVLKLAKEQKIDSKLFDRYMSIFVDFAVTFWPYESMTDFSAKQIGWTGSGWILIDPGLVRVADLSLSNRRDPVSRAHFFSNGEHFPVSDLIIETIKTRIATIRKAHVANSCSEALVSPFQKRAP